MKLKMQAPRLLRNILAQIAESEVRYQRAPHSVSLIAASKSQSIEKIRNLYLAGQGSFGENYLQEALTKIEQLTDCDIEWHFIGLVQRNKTRKIAEHFSWVQSVDDETIAKRLNDQRPVSLPPLNVCIEVNIDRELTKSGVMPELLLPLLDYCVTLPRLSVRGLMAIPLTTDIPQQQSLSFQALHTLWKHCKAHMGDRGEHFDTLSMGMSADFNEAIKEGATMVRIGTALFGERK